MFAPPNIKKVNYVRFMIFVLSSSCSVKEKKLYISERINDWSLVTVLQYPLKVIHCYIASLTIHLTQLGDDLVRPYHAVLLLEDGNKLLSELPSYCSPTFVRLLKVVSPPTRRYIVT